MGAAIDLAATYTEADPNSRITESTVTATFAGIARNEDAYLYKDWGAGYFGDFVHDFETTGTTWANGSKLVVWGLSNSLASKASWAAGLYLQLDATSTTAGTYTLGEIGGSTSVGASIAKTIMYWRIERNGTTLTAKRATSAANRLAGTWAETLTITVATTTYQYQYAGSSVNDSNATTVTQTTANYKGTKMTSAGTPFDSAYMAGASSGNWNAGATWGNTGSVKGTDYPGNAADAVNIDVGDTVTYNVSETNALADVDVYGLLTFSTGANTLLALGHNNLNVKANGELRIGNDASPIGAAYTAELRFNTTADGTKGLWIANGGILSIVGSDVKGGTLQTYLIANWTSGQTFTVYGDVTSKWSPGQSVLVHKFNTSYQSGVECNEYTINSVAANGGNTDITISEAAPGVTFRAGALVGHMTRNVIVTKGSATTTIGSGNVNRPVLEFASTTYTTALAHLKHAVFIGLYALDANTAGRIDLTGCVTRNCRYPFGTAGAYRNYNCVLTDCLFTSADANLILQTGSHFTNCVFMCNASYYQNLWGCIFDNCYFVNIRTYLFTTVGGNIFKNCDMVGFDYIIAASTIINNMFFNCNFGKYRHHANTSTYNYEFYSITSGDSSYFDNCVFGHDPPQVHSTFWGLANAVKHGIDNFNGTSGRHYSWTNWYARASNSSVVRSGGAAASLEIYRLDDCNVRSLVEPIFEWVEWDVPASSQTRTIYIRGGTGGGENWSTFPTAAQLFLEAEYFDEAGTNHVAFAVSDDVLTDNTTWTAFSVTFVPGKAGRVVYRLRVGVGAASVKLYVDPQLNAA